MASCVPGRRRGVFKRTKAGCSSRLLRMQTITLQFARKILRSRSNSQRRARSGCRGVLAPSSPGFVSIARAAVSSAEITAPTTSTSAVQRPLNMIQASNNTRKPIPYTFVPPQKRFCLYCKGIRVPETSTLRRIFWPEGIFASHFGMSRHSHSRENRSRKRAQRFSLQHKKAQTL